MDYSVTLNAAIDVYSVSEEDEAVQIAISKTGDMLNPDMGYVDIDTIDKNSVLVVAGEALVGLHLSMDVYNVEDEEHAERVAKKEIGDELSGVTLSVDSITVLEDEEENQE